MERLHEEARLGFRGAMETMARYQSDQLALLMALPMGLRAHTFEHREQEVKVVETLKVERGEVVGKDITTTTVNKVVQRYHRFE